jgi:hypothetical protein
MQRRSGSVGALAGNRQDHPARRAQRHPRHSRANVLRPWHSAGLHGGYPCGPHRTLRDPKPGGPRNLDPWIGRGRASRHCDCQHHSGREPSVQVRSTPLKS